MLASRVAKPKLSLTISTASAAQSSTRPSLSLKSPLSSTPMRSPASPMVPPSPTPTSPTARNTRLNQRGFCSYTQQPTYAYQNSSASRSILKKSSKSSHMSTVSASSTSSRRQLSFSESPIVYTVTPIEEPDYYGTHQRMSRDERRWMKR